VQTSYERLSCEPAVDACDSIGPTQTPDGVAVSLTGTIVGDTMRAETVNSISGAPASFEATR